jgi:hypothetical protein
MDHRYSLYRQATERAKSVRIEVQRDKENNAQSGNSDWSVNITLTPPGLDTIHCIASYWDNVINTFFKSRNSQTTQLIKHNLVHLKKQLKESGLKTGHLDAHDGDQKTQSTHSNQLSQKKLFDENAWFLDAQVGLPSQEVLIKSSNMK